MPGLLTRLKFAVAARVDRRVEHVLGRRLAELKGEPMEARIDRRLEQILSSRPAEPRDDLEARIDARVGELLYRELSTIDSDFNQRLLMSPSVGGVYNFDQIRWIEAAVTACSYALDHMKDVRRFQYAGLLLDHALQLADREGLILEFGVWSGYTINLIANARPAQSIYGFDSFKGLPDEWFPGVAPGTFDRQGVPPPVQPNVELVIGWFNETLPGFLAEHQGHAAMIHVDCDTYQSTRTVLESLSDRIVPGTIIVFDEYMNYPDWKKHEYKAWQEFVGERRLRYEYIGAVPAHMQVGVRVLPS